MSTNIENRALQLYSRNGCHLCEDMLDALRLYQTELGYSIEVYDIDADAALLDRYNEDVPVVYYNDREIMRYYFELAALQAAMVETE